jgi:glycogenin glucosyltransferase
MQESYDYVIPMPTFTSANRSNLALLQRPDLALTLTKINLWRLVQFRKCVYVDADILALRAPDELFNLDTDFAVPSRGQQLLITFRRHLMSVGQISSIPYSSSSLFG